MSEEEDEDDGDEVPVEYGNALGVTYVREEKNDKRILQLEAAVKIEPVFRKSVEDMVMVNKEKGVFRLQDLMKVAAEVLGNGGLGSAYKAALGLKLGLQRVALGTGMGEFGAKMVSGVHIFMENGILRRTFLVRTVGRFEEKDMALESGKNRQNRRGSRCRDRDRDKKSGTEITIIIETEHGHERSDCHRNGLLINIAKLKRSSDSQIRSFSWMLLFWIVIIYGSAGSGIFASSNLLAANAVISAPRQQRQFSSYTYVN
ncbi:hypothetical protein Tco_0211459 [Tanacetum coccineum]